MKKSIYILLLLVFFSSGTDKAYPIEPKFPSPGGFVNDYAGILSNAAKEKAENVAGEVKNKTTAEIVVAVVGTTAPLTIEQYAVKLFEKWGIGTKGKDNGVLLLVAVDDRKVRIETGYGLEGFLTDLKSSQIINNVIVPEFRKGNFNKGVLDGFFSIANVIAEGYGVSLDIPNGLSRDKEDDNDSPPAWVIILVLIILILSMRFRFYPVILSERENYRGRGNYWSSGGGGSFGGGFGGFGGGMSGGGGASGGW